MVLALIFAELLSGGVLLTSAITGHTPMEVMKGETKPWKSMLSKSGASVKEGEPETQEQHEDSERVAPSPQSIKLPKNSKLNFSSQSSLLKAIEKLYPGHTKAWQEAAAEEIWEEEKTGTPVAKGTKEYGTVEEKERIRKELAERGL